MHYVQTSNGDTNSQGTGLLCPFIWQHFFHAPATNSVALEESTKEWWERVVLMEFDDAEWKENFYMSRRAFVRAMIFCLLSNS